MAKDIAPKAGNSSFSETPQAKRPMEVVQYHVPQPNEGSRHAGSPTSAHVAKNPNLASSGGLARAAVPTSHEPRACVSAPQSNLSASPAVRSVDSHSGDLQPEAAKNEKSSAPGEVVNQPSTYQKVSTSEQQILEGHKMSLGSVLQNSIVPESHGSKRAADEEGTLSRTKRQKGDGIKVEVSRQRYDPIINLTLSKDSETGHIKYYTSWAPSFVPPSSFRCDKPWNKLETPVSKMHGKAGVSKLYEALNLDKLFSSKGHPTDDIKAFYIDLNEEEGLRVLVDWQDTEVNLQDLDLAGRNKLEERFHELSVFCLTIELVFHIVTVL
ncbi:uncharacterized protein B0I36DRAFT_354179 [Microdochium trichocladiopsis]|uniref:Uncharacterized protein n=1 Tax=Microdochium trichocladiopsis TaxID=1682393 RepID=A0A9P8XWL8_9PEZI|nr:uncharacterized protein B0I36DRAFT_354179 [Microdochium trichocladiopsis]KAH7021530.1 hypothetical protein B0I36DRAFT_354179 [Microdochium trichocladiopsis]